MSAEALSPSTLVSRAARQQLATDPSLGAGNALERAVAVSPAPDAPFITFEGGLAGTDDDARRVLSLRELSDLVGAWATVYAQRGVRPRDRVGVYVRDSGEDLIHCLALCRLGAIAVLMNGEMPGPIAADHLRRTGVVGLRTDPQRQARLEPHLSADDSYWWSILGEDDVDGTEQAAPAYRHDESDPILICHSSGTTGVPKPVLWTHGQAIAGVRVTLGPFVDRPGSLVLSALPQSHSSAIGYALLALLTGVPIVILSDRSGPAVAAAADRYGATVVAGFASTFAELSMRALDGADLGTVEQWLSVGDANHHAHIAALVERGRHWVRDEVYAGSMFVDGFGTSELGWGGIFGKITITGSPASFRRLGQPHSFADVTVLREDGSEADVGEVGLLGVQGPTITPGYWNDSDLTYRSRLSGYWLTGDLASRDEHGNFFHFDRTPDAIRTPDGLVLSVLTEEIILSHFPAVADCTVVARTIGSQRHAAVLAVMRDGVRIDGLLEQINAAVASHGQPPVASIEILPGFDDVPVGVTGKVLKRELRTRMEESV